MAAMATVEWGLSAERRNASLSAGLRKAPFSITEALSGIGPSGYANKMGLPVRPVPGRTGLLAGIIDLLPTREVRARLFDMLVGKGGAADNTIKAVMEVTKPGFFDPLVRPVVIAFGMFRVSYFVGASGRVPARSLMPRASSKDFAEAAGRRPEIDKIIMDNEALPLEYRNLGIAYGLDKIVLDLQDKNGLSQKELRCINEILSSHTSWMTYSGYSGALSAHLLAKLSGFVEKPSLKTHLQSWLHPDGRSTVTMDVGLFTIVAKGFNSDGTEQKDGRKPERSTFIGRRLDTLPGTHAKASARLDELKREWGAILLYSYTGTLTVDPAALQSAIEKGCPVDVGSKGEPMARLIYDRELTPHSPVILAAVGQGFIDVGRNKNGSPSPNHPDVLESKFGLFGDYLKEVAALLTPKAYKRPVVDVALAKPSAGSAFGLEFGETCKAINPANVALVFHVDSRLSKTFSIVHRSTGLPLPGLPPILELSNLPEGTYMRMRDDDLGQWKSTPAQMRPPLSSVAAGTAVVTAGHVLTHLDSSGLPHNDFDRASVVKAVRGVDKEDLSPLKFYDKGLEMSGPDFLKKRQADVLAARLADEEAYKITTPEVNLADTFDLLGTHDAKPSSATLKPSR